MKVAVCNEPHLQGDAKYCLMCQSVKENFAIIKIWPGLPGEDVWCEFCDHLGLFCPCVLICHFFPSGQYSCEPVINDALPFFYQNFQTVASCHWHA